MNVTIHYHPCHQWLNRLCDYIEWIGFEGKILIGNQGFYMFLPSNSSGFPVKFPIIQFYEIYLNECDTILDSCLFSIQRTFHDFVDFLILMISFLACFDITGLTVAICGKHHDYRCCHPGVRAHKHDAAMVCRGNLGWHSGACAAAAPLYMWILRYLDPPSMQRWT